MASVSDSTSAAYQIADARSELAATAIREANEQEQAVVERLKETQTVDQEDRRSQRQIPGLGQAVDITV